MSEEEWYLALVLVAIVVYLLWDGQYLPQWMVEQFEAFTNATKPVSPTTVEENRVKYFRQPIHIKRDDDYASPVNRTIYGQELGQHSMASAQSQSNRGVGHVDPLGGDETKQERVDEPVAHNEDDDQLQSPFYVSDTTNLYQFYRNNPEYLHRNSQVYVPQPEEWEETARNMFETQLQQASSGNKEIEPVEDPITEQYMMPPSQSVQSDLYKK